MTSVQERLQLKREPLDKWSIREQLCLSSAVARSGDQNWMSVSRALKPFGEPNRPPDWFHQKNCAAQYGMLLGNVETPKRKKRVSSVDSGIETPAENILKRLLAERQAELKRFLAEEKLEYQKLQEDMMLLQSGKVTEEQLDAWCREIDEEEQRREQEALVHAQWLKEREQRKQEIERAWRPSKPIAGQKRKNSDPLDGFVEQEHQDGVQQQQQQIAQEPPKPGLSPLLTSLLKSPSQVQNASILHSAMTNRPVPTTNTNPMIASLLNSTTNITVSPGLQQLVSTAIGQTQEVPPLASSSNLNVIEEEQQQPLGNDILDDPNLPNIKLDDLANSILVRDGPLPEIKKEEVDDIISEIIENAQDIVDDPEQHLQLDGNGDININLELEDFEDEEEEEEMLQNQKMESSPKFKDAEEQQPLPSVEPKPVEGKSSTAVDPFEFQEDPIVFEPPTKPSCASIKQDPNYVPHYQQMSQDAAIKSEDDSDKETKEDAEKVDDIKKEPQALEEEIPEESIEAEPVEPPVVPSRPPEPTDVPLTNDEERDKDANQGDVEATVQSAKSVDSEDDIKLEKQELEEVKIKTELEDSSTPESKDTATFEESSETSDSAPETKKDDINLEMQQDSMETTMITSDDLYIEMKVDKSATIKRDYSRTKKKEEKDFDMLLAIEKAQLEDSEFTEETFSDTTTDTEKKDPKVKIKSENDRSNSPWTEEEDNSRWNKRRYSTPATPDESMVNSPASTSAITEDERDYKNWKKSVILVFNRLATHKYASIFLKPITDEQAPGYNSLVYRPMDLQTIKKNVENGTIRTNLEFKRDVLVMFTNAMMYNKTNGTIYNMALEMQRETWPPIEVLTKAIEGEEPLRRETRTSESGVKRKRTITDELLKVKKRKDD